MPLRWRRYWARPEDEILIDDGLLVDPASSGKLQLNRDAVSLTDLVGVPCGVLLGEPGVGKTTTLQLELPPAAGHQESLSVDLRPLGSELRLIQRVFHHDTVLQWKNGVGVLHLFLDGLDECRLRLGHIADILLDELGHLPRDRLRLRITCRTGEWPQYLEEGLRGLWGEDSVAVYELLPLTKENISQAAHAKDLDPERFLNEVRAKGVTAFAGRPVTLFFLLDQYAQTGQLPSTKAELYHEGCRFLCQEVSQSRRAARATGSLDSEQRFSLACRVAAIAVFSGRPTIFVGLGPRELAPGEVSIGQVVGGLEPSPTGEIEVNEAHVREVLEQTALFNSRGDNRLGFAHHTYAEFLAAHYVTTRGLSGEQILSLITHPGDPTGKIVPQLHGVAAWLATMQPAVFDSIVASDPQVLLRSDIPTTQPQDRARLVGELLRLFDEGKLADSDMDLRENYRQLTHPDLAAQLEPYLRDQNKGVVVRRVAIDIAEACTLEVLGDLLADLALDSSEQVHVRTQAAYAVRRITEPTARVRLRPLLASTEQEDPDDELKGCALHALWPTHLSAADLFTNLTPLRNPSLMGAYSSFLHGWTDSGKITDTLAVGDIPIALAWTERQPSSFHLDSALRDLMADVFVIALQAALSPDVLPALASAVLVRIRSHDDIISGLLAEAESSPVNLEEEHRRRLVQEIVKQVSDTERDIDCLCFGQTRLMGDD